MGQYTKRVVIGFTIINILLIVGVSLVLWGAFGSFTEAFGGLGPGLIGLFISIPAALVDIIYLIFVLVRKSKNN
ncbi:MAG: hypothetical protein ACTSRD_13720 [Promethearchaeota archaeon]